MGGAATAVILALTLPASGARSDSTYVFTFGVVPSYTGTITALPYGVTCPPQCSLTVSPDQDLYLVAKPTNGNYLTSARLFGSWGQGPAGPAVYLRTALGSYTGYAVYTNDWKPRPPAFQAPISPRDLTVDTSTAGVVTLRWGHSGDYSRDVVRRGDGASCPKTVVDGTFVDFGTAPTSGLGFQGTLTDADVTPGSIYCYSVFTLRDGTPGRPLSKRIAVATTTTVVPQPLVRSYAPKLGNEGRLIQITGANLLQATAVRFGNDALAASFWPKSTTALYAQVPFGAHTGPVTVETPTGTATGLVSFTVPFPTITSFSPHEGHVGDWVTVTGKNFNLLNSIYFGAAAAYHNVQSTIRLIAQVPPGATSGPLETVSTAGNSTTADSFVVLP